MVVDISKIVLTRANKGLSAYELSKLSGLGENTVSKIEKGETTPRLQTIGKIAKALGMRVEDFLAS